MQKISQRQIDKTVELITGHIEEDVSDVTGRDTYSVTSVAEAQIAQEIKELLKFYSIGIEE